MAKGGNIKAKVKMPTEVGRTGFKKSNGVIREEFLPALKWPDQNKVFKEMSMNDATIGAVLFAITNTIKKVPISVKDNGDAEGAKFLQECLSDMDKDFNKVLDDILTFLPYGFSVLETVYKQRVGPLNSNPRRRSKYKDYNWGWKKFPIRAQDTLDGWVFEGEKVDDELTIAAKWNADSSELAGVWQQIPETYQRVYISRNKFLLFRNNTTKDNPESTSVLRTAYRSWYLKKNLEDIEAIGVERALVNVPVVYMPGEYMSDDADDAQKAVYKAFQNLVVNLRNNSQSGAVIPGDRDETGNRLFELKFEGGANIAGAQDVDKIIQRYDVAIMSAVLADFIKLGQNKSGSGALAGNKIKLFKAAIEDWLTSIIDVFNKEAIPRLWEMNGWEPDSTMPSLEHGSIMETSLEELADYLDKLAERSLIEADDELEEELRKKANLPKKKSRRLTKEENLQESKNKSTKEVAQIQQTNKGKDNATADGSTESSSSD